MSNVFLTDDLLWKKPFVSDVEGYKKARAEYLNSKTEETTWSKDLVKRRIIDSMNFVFLLLKKEISEKLGFSLRTDCVKLDAKRIPVRIMVDFDLVGTGTEWVYIEINTNTIDTIVDDLFVENRNLVELKRFTEDWCQFLEGSMIQEFAHILYIQSVCRSHNKNLFVQSFASYPILDVDVDSHNRDKYLATEIERHGRAVQVDFLRKVYPNSWALAWCEHDLKRIKELDV